MIPISIAFTEKYSLVDGVAQMMLTCFYCLFAFATRETHTNKKKPLTHTQRNVRRKCHKSTITLNHDTCFVECNANAMLLYDSHSNFILATTTTTTEKRSDALNDSKRLHHIAMPSWNLVSIGLRHTLMKRAEWGWTLSVTRHIFRLFVLCVYVYANLAKAKENKKK